VVFILKSLRHVVVRSELALEDTNPEEQEEQKNKYQEQQ
jgi:hypothetical protein